MFPNGIKKFVVLQWYSGGSANFTYYDTEADAKAYAARTVAANGAYTCIVYEAKLVIKSALPPVEVTDVATGKAA